MITDRFANGRRSGDIFVSALLASQAGHLFNQLPIQSISPFGTSSQAYVVKVPTMGSDRKGDVFDEAATGLIPINCLRAPANYVHFR